jgi:hypothetical protein
MAGIATIVQNVLNVMEAYAVHTLAALGTIYNFRVWVNLENNRSLEIGVKNIRSTRAGGGGGTWNYDYLQ